MHAQKLLACTEWGSISVVAQFVVLFLQQDAQAQLPGPTATGNEPAAVHPPVERKVAIALWRSHIGRLPDLEVKCVIQSSIELCLHSAPLVAPVACPHCLLACSQSFRAAQSPYVRQPEHLSVGFLARYIAYRLEVEAGLMGVAVRLQCGASVLNNDETLGCLNTLQQDGVAGHGSHVLEESRACVHLCIFAGSKLTPVAESIYCALRKH